MKLSTWWLIFFVLFLLTVLVLPATSGELDLTPPVDLFDVDPDDAPSDEEEDPTDGEEPPEDDADDADGTDDTPVPAPVPITGDRFYYGQLDDIGQTMYKQMYESMAQGKKQCVFTDVDTDEYKDRTGEVVLAVTADHPELFWVTNGSTTTYPYLPSSSGKVTVEFDFYAFWEYTAEKQAQIDELGRAADAIIEKARAAGGTLYDQILFVHDYIAENTYYDHKALAERDKTVHDPECEYIGTAYGCLVQGRAVCGGYAQGFQLVMHKMGVPCSFVYGDAGGPHGWNCVWIEGEPYYVDVTWDDYEQEEFSGVAHNYCFITEERLERTHVLTMDPIEYTLPDCDNTKYNYFEYFRFIDREEYDLPSVQQILSLQRDKAILEVQFETRDAYQAAYSDVLSGADWVSWKCGLIPNTDHRTLALFRAS